MSADTVLLICVFLVLYFYPTLKALDERLPAGKVFKVFLFNLFFGWTIYGWIVAANEVNRLSWGLD